MLLMLFSLSSHASFVSCSCCFMVLFVSSYSCSLLFRIIHGSFCFVLFIILLFHAPSHAPFVSCSFLFRLIHAPFCFVLFMLLLFHAPFLFRLIHVPFLLLFSLCLFCASSPCRSLSLFSASPIAQGRAKLSTALLPKGRAPAQVQEMSALLRANKRACHRTCPSILQIAFYIEFGFLYLHKC